MLVVVVVVCLLSLFCMAWQWEQVSDSMLQEQSDAIHKEADELTAAGNKELAQKRAWQAVRLDALLAQNKAASASTAASSSAYVFVCSSHCIIVLFPISRVGLDWIGFALVVFCVVDAERMLSRSSSQAVISSSASWCRKRKTSASHPKPSRCGFVFLSLSLIPFYFLSSFFYSVSFRWLIGIAGGGSSACGVGNRCRSVRSLSEAQTATTAVSGRHSQAPCPFFFFLLFVFSCCVLFVSFAMKACFSFLTNDFYVLFYVFQ